MIIIIYHFTTFLSLLTRTSSYICIISSFWCFYHKNEWPFFLVLGVYKLSLLNTAFDLGIIYFDYILCMQSLCYSLYLSATTPSVLMQTLSHMSYLQTLSLKYCVYFFYNDEENLTVFCMSNRKGKRISRIAGKYYHTLFKSNFWQKNSSINIIW